ncbi:MAG: ATP-dependent helicase [Deltaproteobacteria bacterium]|nr:ATP-dependent helicase [Deltaproteobacteria bacterium]
MTLDLEGLNSNQRVAVEWDEGPLLVLAGPGSGKTRVLTIRVAKLVLDSPGKRFRVLGLTFTNKAAAEMRQRVEELVPDSRERVLLTTFHSFCADILRQHGSHVGIKPDFVILNQDSDREGVLGDAITAVSRKGIDTDKNDMKLLPMIDRLLSNAVPESQVARLVQDQDFAWKLSALYTEYRRQLISNNRLDFSSLLIIAYNLLTEKPAIAKQIRTIYAHICVDEFQDTNLVQYLVLKAIVGDDPQNLFVVADDDQIIYQWNGASPERLNSLRDDFKMSVVQLPANYRCPPEVIVLANRLIQHNLERAADKEPLYAIKEETTAQVVRIQKFPTMDDELGWVAEDIATQHGGDTGECAILARTKRILESAVAKMQARGIAASLTIRKTEFASAPFRWLHAVLRLANARSDREQLRRLCKAFFEIEGVDLDVQEITADAARVGGDLLRCWFETALVRDGVDGNTVKFLESGQRNIVNRLNVLGFSQSAFTWFAEQDKKLGTYTEEGFADYNEEKSIWENLQQRVVDKYGRDELTLNTFLQEFDLSEKSAPIPANAVRCLTIHSSKGMEFRHVYLIGLAEDELPSFQSIKKGDKSREMQEERRNCFVAITRAQESLTITYAVRYRGWDKKPSRFLSEMGLV